MICKKIYLGQELTQEDWDYGLGSIYLAGPRNPKGKSWKAELIKKFEQTQSPLSLFIPETKNQLNGGFNKSPLQDKFKWQHSAMSLATTVIFWFPAGCSDAQSYVEFGAWHKADRVFFGREASASNEYLDWVLRREQKLYPAETMDQLVEMVIHWLKE